MRFIRPSIMAICPRCRELGVRQIDRGEYACLMCSARYYPGKLPDAYARAALGLERRG